MAKEQPSRPPSMGDERISLEEHVKQYFNNEAQIHEHNLLREMSLHKTPEISPLFVKQYISTESQVAMRDPKSFSIRPPAWRRWSAYRYRRLYEFVEENINLLPFAEQENLSLEEVQVVFNRTIGLDLDNKFDFENKKRMDKAVLDVLKEANDHAEPLRQWTAKSISAYLKQVHRGVIELVSPNGTRVLIRREHLIEADLIYIKRHATEEAWCMLQEDRGKPDERTWMVVQD